MLDVAVAEIGELTKIVVAVEVSPQVSPKFLQVLQSKDLPSPGGERRIRSDVSILGERNRIRPCVWGKSTGQGPVPSVSEGGAQDRALCPPSRKTQDRVLCPVFPGEGHSMWSCALSGHGQ